MRTIDWDAHRAHRNQVVEDSTSKVGDRTIGGQWVGLLDEDFCPILDFPPLISMEWPDARGAIDSVKFSFRARTPSGRMHAAVNELVAHNLGKVDSAGQLVPISGPARLATLQRSGGQRRDMLITHVQADGDAQAPHTLTVFGVSVEGYLDLLPCPSNPLSWEGNFTRFQRDWVGPEDTMATFRTPRDLANMNMLTVSDGASVQGKSDEVVYRLIKESLDAVHRMAGIVENPPYVAVLDPPRGYQERMIHQPTDQTIWQEIGDRALAAGVSIRAGIWWPGDPQPGEGMTLTLPTLVFRVRQEA